MYCSKRDALSMFTVHLQLTGLLLRLVLLLQLLASRPHRIALDHHPGAHKPLRHSVRIRKIPAASCDRVRVLAGAAERWVVGGEDLACPGGADDGAARHDILLVRASPRKQHLRTKASSARTDMKGCVETLSRSQLPAGS